MVACLCSCARFYGRGHFYSNLRVEVGGIFTFLCIVPCVYCISHCVATVTTLLLFAFACVESRRLHSASASQKKEPRAQQLLNSSPDFVFLVVAHILNHNSGGCSGNFGFLQLALGFEGGP